MVLQPQTLEDGHLYLVPRMFPGYKEELINKYGYVYDLCLYSQMYQHNTSGKMTNFLVIDSDKRDPYCPYEIWQTSSIKINYIGKKNIISSIDVTNIYANKIQRWYTKIQKDRAAKFISEMLFMYMIEPSTGWLYKRALNQWNTMHTIQKSAL